MSYVKKIRQKIGHDPLFLPGISLLVYENNQYLLQFRTDFKIWGLHGGSMEIGEEIQKTAIRELREETGLYPLQIDMFKIYSGPNCKIIYPNNDVVFAVVIAFLVTKTTGQIRKDIGGEVSDLRWFKEKDLPIDDNMMLIDKMFLTDFLDYKKDKKQYNTFK